MMITRATQVSNLEKWIVELRSGKYIQVRGGLRKNYNGYCCLGVACNILSPDAWKIEDGLGMAAEISYFWETENSVLRSYLNQEIRHMFGLTREEERDLASMNDSGMSFDIIATEIEARILPRVKELAKPVRSLPLPAIQPHEL